MGGGLALLPLPFAAKTSPLRGCLVMPRGLVVGVFFGLVGIVLKFIISEVKSEAC